VTGRQRPSADTDYQDGNVAAAAELDPLGEAGDGDEHSRLGRSWNPWRAAFFTTLTLAIAGLAVWVVFGSKLLVVRHVVVVGNRQVTAAQVRSAAEVRQGQPLATVDTSAIAGRVDQIAAVLSAHVTRSWPDTIVISVTERTPALAVAADGGGFLLIDEHGVTVRWAARKPAGMPVLTAPPAVLRGSPAVRAAVVVLAQLPRTVRDRLLAVTAPTASTVTLQLTGGITVVWGGPGHASRKAAELAMLLPTHAHFYDVSDPDTVVTQQ
jgi:cell division protein FtsQ